MTRTHAEWKKEQQDLLNFNCLAGDIMDDWSEEREQLQVKKDIEKNRRVHWQDLAYAGMIVVDRVLGKSVIHGTGTTEDEFKENCQTALIGITRLQSEVESLIQQVNNWRGQTSNADDEGMRWKDRADKTKAEVERLKARVAELEAALKEAQKRTHLLDDMITQLKYAGVDKPK